MKETTKKERILREIENIGNEVKKRTEPCFWSYEDHYRVKAELLILDLLRKMYKEIKNSNNWEQIFWKYVNNVPGIEGNKLKNKLK